MVPFALIDLEVKHHDDEELENNLEFGGRHEERNDQF